jgi:hypothetical protein
MLQRQESDVRDRIVFGVFDFTHHRRFPETLHR